MENVKQRYYNKLKGYEPETRLEQYVKKWLLENSEPYDEYLTVKIEDIINYGCVSGQISELISYKQTSDFFDKYEEDIENLLINTLQSFGNNASPTYIFGEKWDNYDPFCNDMYNKNIMAWFAFEETVDRVANYIGIEV